MIQQAPIPERARTQKLECYLASLRDAKDISAHTAQCAWQIWNLLDGAMHNRLSVPDAAHGPDGQLLYAWNRGEHHLEVEIFPDGPAEFFYLNRVSDETWEAEYIVGDPVSDAIQIRLNLVA